MFLYLIVSTTFGQGIKFEETTWKEALEKAKAADKPLLWMPLLNGADPARPWPKMYLQKEEVGKFLMPILST